MFSSHLGDGQVVNFTIVVFVLFCFLPMWLIMYLFSPSVFLCQPSAGIKTMHKHKRDASVNTVTQMWLWTRRWWWPTLCPMTCRNCSVPKSKRWTWAWSWPKPSAASTTESPWRICSATSPWTTEAAWLLIFSIPAHKDKLCHVHTKTTKETVCLVFVCFNFFSIPFLFHSK